MIDSEREEIEIVIPLKTANVYSFLFFLAALALFGLPYSLIWSTGNFILAWRSFLTDYILLIVSILGGMLLHEVIHAVAWSAFADKGLKSIRFGINWKNLAPYVHCDEYLRLPSFALGVALPGILLGVLPAVASLITGSGWLLCFGVFFTAGAAGDFLSLLKLRSFPPSKFVMDHSDHLGFIVRLRE
jgi:hypothetical protein